MENIFFHILYFSRAGACSLTPGTKRMAMEKPYQPRPGQWMCIRLSALCDAMKKVSVGPPVGGFEWLADPRVLVPLLKPLVVDLPTTIVDLGCGASHLGIELRAALSDSRRRSVAVLNVDVNRDHVDKEYSEGCADELVKGSFADLMKEKELSRVLQEQRHHDTVLENESGQMSLLLLDKSTLDCMLASPVMDGDRVVADSRPYTAAAQFLLNVRDGFHAQQQVVYVCISYHDPTFLLPLLTFLFSDIDVQSVDRVESSGKDANRKETVVQESAGRSWERKNVYMYTARSLRKKPSSGVTGDDGADPFLESLRLHITMHLDAYFSNNEPLVDAGREKELRAAWGGARLSIPDAYALLFEEDVKSIYEVDDFRADLMDFAQSSGGTLDRNGGGEAQTLSVDEALAFVADRQ